MKNWKVLVFVLASGIAFFGCSAGGNTGGQPASNEQRLIGTWTNINDNSIIVLNANGMMTWDSNYRYGAAANKLVYYVSNNTNGYTANVLEYYISTDGKLLIIIDKDKDGYVFRKTT